MIKHNKIKEYKLQARTIIFNNLFNILLFQLLVLLVSNLFISLLSELFLKNEYDQNTLINISYISNIFISLPLNYGYSTYLYNSINNTNNLKDIISGFNKNYIKIIGCLILSSPIIISNNYIIIISFILSIIFMFTYFVLIKYPNLDFYSTITKTLELSKNNRLNAIIIQLSFIPIILLSMVLFFIPLIYIIPYMALTELLFINDIDN